MTRKLLFAAFLLTLALTFVAAHHQLTNAAPNMAPPPKQAPPLEQYVARLAPAAVPGDPVWQVVAGGGGKDYYLADVSMTSPDEGWAVGVTGPSSYGVIMHYTNTTWSHVQVPTGTYYIDAVSMISPTEGWAAGSWACSWGTCNQGLIMHYTASTGWQTATVPTRPDGNFWSGFYGIDIKGATGWIVGENYFGSDNYFLQFDGTSWTPVTAPLQANDVFVIDANEAWAVGRSVSGTLLHFSNGSWSLVTPTLGLSGTNPYVYLNSAHMLSASVGWAVGHVRTGTSPNYSYQCLILRYDGSDWSQIACPADTSNARLNSVRIRSANDVWAVGRDGVILHYDGSGWTRAAAPSGTHHLNSVRLIGTNDGWAVGSNGTILRLVSENWTRIQGSNLIVGPMDSVSTDEAWYGGNAGQLNQWKDGTINTTGLLTTSTITALDMFSPTLGWVATGDPDYQVLQYSNGTLNTIATGSRVRAISIVNPNDVYLAANNGILHYYYGTLYYGNPVNANSLSMLDAIYGWAIAGSQVYTHIAGIFWSPVSPTLLITGSYRTLKITAINPNEAWVAGWSVTCTTVACPASSQLHHFAGGTWTSVPMPDWLGFYDISKVSATEWWAVGKLTTMEYAFLHYKDGTYTVVPSAGEDVLGVSMLPDGTGFARGVGSLLKLVFPVTTTVDPGTSTMLVYTNTSNLTTTVSIPAGAVTSTITLIYTPLYTASALGGFSFAGHAFQFDTYSGTTAMPGFVFSKPVTITIHYSDADVVGLDEDSLVLRYWTGSAWASDGISVIERNPAQNYVVLTITHLCQFALFGVTGPSQVAGVSLVNSQNGTVYPGQSIVYQHTLTNTGTGSDSFTVTASIDRPGWSVLTAPSVVGPLNSGIASSVAITVTAPSGITATISASARITATSQFDVGVAAAVVDVTTAHPYQVYLPIVIK